MTSSRHVVEGSLVTADPINEYVNLSGHISGSIGPILMKFRRHLNDDEPDARPRRDTDSEHAECNATAVY
jgi:hypothetical protein